MKAASIAAGLLIVAGLWSSSAIAATSSYCPTPLTATVSSGGSVQINVSACDGPLNAGLSADIHPLITAHGTATIGENVIGTQYVTYVHGGDSATSDTFSFLDEDNNDVVFAITITPPTSTIVVTPASLPTMTAGTPFSQTLASSGGTGAYTYSIAGGALPTGLSLSAAGVLGGTPTQRGSYSFSVRSQDSVGATAFKGYTGTVQNPALAISPASGSAIQGVPFLQTLSASGGVAPHAFAVESGALPSGISISSSGVVSGTTVAAVGNYPVVLRVTDSSTPTASAYFELESYSLTVAAPPSVSISVAPASVDENGAANLVYTVTRSTALASATTVNIATSGTATAGTDYTGGVVTVTIPGGATTATITLDPSADTTVEVDETAILTVAPGTGYTVGAPAAATGTILNDDRPTASIAVAPASVIEDGATNLVYTVTLDQPAATSTSIGFSLSGSALQGTDFTATASPLVIAAGSTTGTIVVDPIADPDAEPDESVQVSLEPGTGYLVGVPNAATATIVNDDVPITISPASLVNGTVAAAYSQTVTASGGAAPYTFALTGGALPPGMTLSSSGQLSGTPTAGGTFNFTVTATDSSPIPGPFSGSRAYTLVIAAPTLTLPAPSLAAGALGTPYSANLGLATGGTAPYAYALTSGALPAGISLSSAGVLSGTPTAVGTYTFSVTATDSSTGTGPYSVVQSYVLVVADVPPVANPVSATVAYGSAGNPVTLNITGGAPVSVAIASAPAHGVATVSGTSVSYTPVAGFAGADSFTYTASNSGGTSAPATVDVTVVDPVITITAASPLSAALATAYSQTFTFNGGAQPWSGYQVINLPTGLAITGTTANTVTVSGTPAQAGSFALTVSATDSSTGSGPYTVSQVFDLTVAAPTLTLTPAAGTLTAPYAAAFSQDFTAGGGIGPYTYAVSGALPAGLSFSGGVLSGTASAPGSYTITVTATDTGATGAGAPFSVAQNYTVSVAAPAIVVDPAVLPNTTAGAAYSQSITATGGAAPYTYTVSAGALPNGLSLDAGGSLSGITNTSGTFNFTVTATDANAQTASQAYTVAVAVPTVTLTPATLPAGSAGVAYNQALTVAGGIAPYTVALTGALPAGLNFNASTRTFSGTPTQSGTFNISVTVTDSTGGTAATVTNAYTLTVAAPTLSLTPASLPAGTAGAAYSQTFVASGGVAPYAYAISAGALPAGLVLDAGTGALTGTPTQAGTFSFSVSATDSTTGTAGTVSNAYTLTVSAPSIAVNPPVLPAGVAGVSYTQALNAIGGTAPHTFAVTDGALPAGLTLAGDGRISGEPMAGTYAFTVTATDAMGFTGTRAYTLEITERPDPSRDPEVRGLLQAQSESARRFASAQMGNFHQRLENLHDNREGAQLSNRLSFATSQKCQDHFGRKPGDPCLDRVASNDPVSTGASDHAVPAGTGEGAGKGAGTAAFGTWIGGVIRSGNQDGRGGGSRVDFETDGVSVGADRRFGPAFALGAGLGYGRDKSDVGDNGSRVEGDAYAFVLYASYHPGDRYFLDALAGYQRLSYDLRRHVTDTADFVHGSRDGTQWFGSVSAGAQFQRDNWQLTPYARLDMSQATLDAYVEQGDPVNTLAYGEQDVDATTGNVGLRFESRHVRSWGVFAPQTRLEYQHDFNGDSSATMQYADLLTGPLYRAELDGFDRSRFLVGVGGMFYLPRDFTVRAEYRGLFGNNGDRDNGVLLNFEKSY